MTIPYDYEQLKKARGQTAENIETIETCLAGERTKLAELDAYIKMHQDNLKAHGRLCALEGHKWQVDETFGQGSEHMGKWKKRHCTECPTTEQVGRD